MDTKQFVEKELKEAVEDREKTLKSANKELQELKEYEEIIKKLNISETTDAIEKVKAANGKSVRIVTYGFKNVDYDHKVQELKYDGGRVLVDGYVSVPLIGRDAVVSIIDAETEEVIFDNPYYKENVAIQKAYLLGKKAGLEEIESEKKSAESRKAWAKERYEETEKAFKKAEGWFEEGKKYIYPQKTENWQECVYYRASDIYHGWDVENALQIIKALDEGKEMKDVEKLIDEGHSGASFGMLCRIVLHFSKRGPEFFREKSDGYKYAKGEDKEKYDKMLEEVEAKNAQYEKELKNEGISK